MTKSANRIKTGLVAILLILFAMTNASAALYRWVDTDGRVHYSDKVPPSASKLQRKELSEQGLIRKVYEAEKTRDQLAEDRRRHELERAAKEAAERQAYLDRILIQTYNSVADMEKARNSRVQTIENLIKLTRGILDGLNKDLDALIRQAATFERQGMEVDIKTQKNIDKIRLQIKEKEDLIATKRKEQETIRVRFAKDILRFKELTGQI